MRTWWLGFLLVACNGTKPQPPFADEWTTRPLEPFSNKLVVDSLDYQSAAVTFSIQLPHGMFHDPRSTPDHSHNYGVWTSDGLEDPNTPGVDLRLAPYDKKTLDAFVAQNANGDQVVSKDTLADGTLTMTLRRNARSWRVEQLHFDHAGHQLQCDAWSDNEQHDLGEPTRHMLERMCGSLVIDEAAANGSAAKAAP